MAATKTGSQRPYIVGLDTGVKDTSTLSDVTMCKVIVLSAAATSARGTVLNGCYPYDNIVIQTSGYLSTVALNVGTSASAIEFCQVSGRTGTSFISEPFVTATARARFDGAEIVVATSGSASPTGSIRVYIPYVMKA